jgi:hypothetical protein
MSKKISYKITASIKGQRVNVFSSNVKFKTLKDAEFAAAEIIEQYAEGVIAPLRIEPIKARRKK